MRIVNFLLAVMFLVFAFLQINDPDPLIWILIYGVMAVYCIMAIFSFYPQKLLLATIAIYVLYGLSYINGVIAWAQSENPALLFSDVAKMDYWYIEEAREFLGLLICLGILIFYIIRSRSLRKSV